MSNLPDSMAACVLQKPQTVCTDSNTNTIKAVFLFPETFVGFDGHFPNNPIVPGIVQIMAAAYAITGNDSQQLKTVKRCKFVSPIKPNERVNLTVTTTQHEQHIDCSAQLDVAGEQCSIISFSIETMTV